MALITGTPVGAQTTQYDIYPEGAPNLWYQDDRANLLNNPQVNGYYWGLSATATYPVIALGCVEGITLGDNLTMNNVQCDTEGVRDVVQRRNFLEVNLTLKTLFPLTTIRHILHGGAVLSSGGVEYMGLGNINNNLFFRLYGAKVYDDDTGDYLNFTMHRCKFVDAWTLNFRYGQEWTLTGLKVHGFARVALPSDQAFMTILRADPSQP